MSFPEALQADAEGRSPLGVECRPNVCVSAAGNGYCPPESSSVDSGTKAAPMADAVGPQCEETNTAVSLITLQRDIANLCRLINEFTQAAADEVDSQRVMTDLSRRCQALIERTLEREVLRPVLLTLIGISERRRDQVTRLAALSKVYADCGQHELALQLRVLQDVNEADLIEVENRLAALAVERFQSPAEHFDCTTQSCMSCIETADASMRNTIASRLRPGYRRDGVLLQRECVNVYVVPIPIEPQKGT